MPYENVMGVNEKQYRHASTLTNDMACPSTKVSYFLFAFMQCLSHHRFVQGFLSFVQQQFWDLLSLFTRVLAQHINSRVTGFSFGSIL